MQEYIFIGGGAIVGIALGVMGWILAIKRKGLGSATTSKLASTLRDEKAKSDIILGAIQDGVVLVDDQQIIQHFNQGATSITGWTKQEAQGLDWHSVLKFVSAKGEVIPTDLTPLAKAFSTGQPLRDNALSIMTKADTIVATNFSVSPLVDSGKHVTGMVAIFRDVSEERAEENQRAEFISTASHEMRTPVAAIEGYLSLALNEKVAIIDNRARDYLEKAHSSTKHLGQLFQDLLTSAKAEDGRLTNHPKVVEMGAFLEQLAQDLRFSAEKKGLFMEFLFGNSSIKDASGERGEVLDMNKVIRPLYYVQVDPDRMREVITNIFDNSCKYTEEGKVSLGLTGNDGVVQVYVKDTGAGIPTEDIPHLFQKFYRVDNSATRTIGGTGLGLFICRKIVELYQGRIWVESELGKGSTFYINIPRITSQKAEQLMATEAANPLNTTTVVPSTTAQVSTNQLS
ncbi:PAS domain-containing sensor histidine kinase [Candidatus Saccharibacteria bacterium]|nr:MAG: PAS domain-containing sensor histidine kinase [Candidatus Saccharibacteria bacterium]